MLHPQLPHTTRLHQFGVGDSIICPVSIVIVGNKSDLRSQRDMPDEKDLTAQIHAQYSNKNNEPSNNVIYVECSAQTSEVSTA